MLKTKTFGEIMATKIPDHAIIGHVLKKFITGTIFEFWIKNCSKEIYYWNNF
jgi:hypothetical protein